MRVGTSVAKVLVCAVAALALPATAGASPWHRGCANAKSGFLTQSLQYEVNGPVYVDMSAQTASSIARRTPPGEFGVRESARRDVPCHVAWGVAGVAANAWEHWQADTGVVGAAMAGYSPGPYLGRFSCSGWEDHINDTHETCQHKADRHAGAIAVRFMVQPRQTGQ